MKKVALLCLGTLLLFATQAQRTILIQRVNVIDVEKGTLLKNVHVLIKDSIITQISPRKSTPAADTVIDGNNRYLIPGLWDMHTHVWNDAMFFPLLLANGITGVRDMFDDINQVRNWRRNIANGKPGPQIVAAGPIVDGPQPVWPGSVAIKDTVQARRAVDSLKNILHTDFIKVYSLLSREAYFAIADEAKKQHIPFAGHVPGLVSVVEAAQAGQKSQEHLYGFMEAASDSADYYMQLVQKKITDTTLKSSLQRRRFLHRTYNFQKLQQILQQIKQYDTWICPTLTVNYSIGNMADTSLLNDPRMQYIPPMIRNTWIPSKSFTFRNWTAETFELWRREFPLKQQIVKAMHDAGIPLLAGTDFPNPYCYPGFGLHDELQLMVKAGLTPVQALQTATINAARYINRQNQLGTVATGKIADLVLLQGNPLTDIRNTQSIYAVIVHGKVLNQSDIHSMLEKAKKMAGN